MSNYRSSVLRCFDPECDCEVCAFLAGTDTSPDTLLKVVSVLDYALADAERRETKLVELVISLSEEKE